MSKLNSLSHDSLMDILLFCHHDDFKTVMNLAFTCSYYYHTITECFDRFWIAILKEMEKQNHKRFKAKTLSIINNPAIPNRGAKILTIVKEQIRYERKGKILKEYNELEMVAKYHYFKNLRIHDSYLRRMVAKEIRDSLRYSPENILDIEEFRGSILKFFREFNPQHFEVKDFIDSLYRKSGAHLEMDIKNRTMSSLVYDLWKNQFSIMDNLVHVRYRIVSCPTVESAVLFLKFFYLEFPNNARYGQRFTQTGYEQEKDTRGAFKYQLEDLQGMYQHTKVLLEAIQIFKKELYDE